MERMEEKTTLTQKYEDKVKNITPQIPNQQFTNTVSTEDLNKIRELQQKYSEIMIEFGQLKVEKIATQQSWTKLLQREHELEQLYLVTQEQEQLIAKEITEKYGMGNLNMETGELTK